MRKFSSYGPINTKLHYYAPREELIAKAYTQLVGEHPEEGGHYITVWAPRQSGKSWLMLQIVQQLKQANEFEVAILTMQSAKEAKSDQSVLELFVRNLRQWFKRDFLEITAWQDLSLLFAPPYFTKPVILLLDEFDALDETFINKFANEFRNMYMARRNEADKVSGEKECVLHGLALIGVRSVLGIGNVSGSPFNVQRSVHIPNLTFEEVDEMFKWYERESGQHIEQDVVNRLYYELNGQPGLTGWFGELLTEGFEAYVPPIDRPITMEDFNQVFLWATKGLPNNNIINLISKAKQAPYKPLVLDLFRTSEKLPFKYDNPELSFLYMNGVIDIESEPDELYAKFSCPFVQKRLFYYFAHELFDYTGKLHEPFEDLSDIITENQLNIPNLMTRFQTYLRQNREWLLRDAPKRKDLRIYEAVFHFCLYRYLYDFLGFKRARVYPEFPTGNGKIDLLITYRDRTYGLELKSYTDEAGYHDALEQAARYGGQLGLTEIFVVFFVEYIDDANREKYEMACLDESTGVNVVPVFVETSQ